MSYSFDAVNDDINVSGMSPVIGVVLTVMVRMRPTSMGSGNTGSVFERVDKSPNLRFNGVGGSNKLRWDWFFTGTDGQWTLDTALTVPGLSTVIVAHDGSSDANNPLAWINGISTTITENTSPAGSAEGSGAQVRLGFANAVGRYGGDIEEFALWERIFTADDVAEVTVRGPLSRPKNLAIHWRLNGQALDASGKGRHGTVSGATAVGHTLARIPWPVGPRMPAVVT